MIAALQHREKEPEDWVSGGDPMPYLKTLSGDAPAAVQVSPDQS